MWEMEAGGWQSDERRERLGNKGEGGGEQEKKRKREEKEWDARKEENKTQINIQKERRGSNRVIQGHTALLKTATEQRIRVK